MFLFFSIMTLVVAFLTILATWRYGDWRNWQRYYPTILFMIGFNLLSSLLQYDYPLWHFERTVFIPNHTLADFFIILLNLVPLVVLFVSRYPFQSKWWQQLTYLLAYTAVYFMAECLFFWGGLTTYHNGWTIWWSLLIWGLMFLMFRVHHTRPLLAWAGCLAFTAYIIAHFDIPISQFP